MAGLIFLFIQPGSHSGVAETYSLRVQHRQELIAFIFEEEYLIAEAITYNGTATTGQIGYQSGNSHGQGSVRSTDFQMGLSDYLTMRIKASTVSLPEYNDEIVYLGQTWLVKDWKLNGQVWELALLSSTVQGVQT